MEDNLIQLPSGVEAEWVDDELSLTDYNRMETVYLDKHDTLKLRTWLNQVLSE